MKASISRWVIAISTALLIAITYLMIVFTSPSMLVGMESAEPIEISVQRNKKNEGAVGTININAATVEELMTLPNLGEVLAGRIVAYREEHGRYSDVDELLNIEGIGESRMAQWRSYLVIQ